MANDVRVRFAPSPTGFLHVGGARTMLFNWLFARKNKGKLILRVEDTDASRNTEEAVQAISAGLNWLGLDWDEGVERGGEYGPYYQSQRNAIYESYLARLEKTGRVYEDKGALRFRSGRGTVVVEDEICGRIAFDMSNPVTNPDITIRRPDGGWIFHFVNVVDDVEMRLTHVIRGEDHLSNTPKHVELYEALGEKPPKFAHIPLLLNDDGSKMSKRDMGSSIAYYMEQGYVPEAVVNYLCLLGWSPKDNREILSLSEVIELFDLSKINRRNAKFDLDKCFWINGQYIAAMDDQRFGKLARPVLEQAGIVWEEDDYLERVLAIVKEKIKLLSELPGWTGFFFVDEVTFEADALEKLRLSGVRDRLEKLGAALAELKVWEASAIEEALKATASAAGEKNAAFVHPARVAVSGRTVGPSLYHMLEVMGRDRVVARFQAAREHAG